MLAIMEKKAEKVFMTTHPDSIRAGGWRIIFVNALALLLIAITYEKFQPKWIKWAGNCFITGIILFSGSLYLLTLLKIQESSAVRFVGPVTPLGGLCFIAGWLLLLAAVVKKKN